MTEVVVYSSNMCGPCEMVKGYLKLNNVNFVEKNVTTDQKGRSELTEQGFDSTPVAMIGDQWISGFDVKEIDAAIALVRQTE
ncbi:MAG: NrdH-redoxin [Chloroflexi bacterium]|nr:NrdH-redoxin [Chloroflexota bacterium]